MSNPSAKKGKWQYPVLYTAFFIISMLPLYTEKPYNPQETQDVIINLLMVATNPYKAYAPIFHVLTLLMMAFIARQPAKFGRVWAGYMGLNYLIIVLVQGILPWCRQWEQLLNMVLSCTQVELYCLAY